jgi:hypothetical protein
MSASSTDRVARQHRPSLSQQLIEAKRLGLQLHTIALQASRRKLPIRDLNHFTVTLAGKPLEWPRNTPNRWDLASTGSIGNITPIVGYLWLMTRAGIYVPKISSRGTSCGTVDILEAAGIRFPSSGEAIKQLCQNYQGVLCCSGPNLAPLDKQLMEARRETHTMKVSALVYSSILAKKIAIGCTHAIVDIKVGRDTKFEWRPGNREVGLSKGLICRTASVRKSLASLRVRFKRMTNPLFLEQRSDDLPQDTDLKSVRWFATNADVPQCRAIGRYLILVQLELMLSNVVSSGLPPAYDSFYFTLLPQICGIDSPRRKEICQRFLDLRKEWKAVRGGEAQQLYERIMSSVVENMTGYKSDREIGTDLACIRRPAPIVHRRRMVKWMDAYALDGIFSELCKEEKYDPAVGLWLHKLPGEHVNGNEAFITVFYRPSRASEEEVNAQLDRFFFRHVGTE